MNSIALVLMNSAIAFVLAVASILLVAAIARYAAGYFGSDKASRIAAFGVALGYALGHFPGSNAANFEQLPSICAPLGAVAERLGQSIFLHDRQPRLDDGCRHECRTNGRDRDTLQLR